MPPTGALSEKEIESLRTWIREGAPWDSGASFTKEHTVVPEAKELFQAIRRGEIPAMRRILDRDPKLIGTVDENGSTPLILAAYWAGPSEVKEMLVRGADPNAKNDSGVAALIPATDNLETSRLLVEAGADVNARTEAGDSALIVAARRAGAARVVEYLLDKGANIKASTKDGATALHRAAECGDVDMIRLLLDKGADINAQRKSGRVPLASAVVFGHGNAVRYLLSKGAKTNLGNIGIGACCISRQCRDREGTAGSRYGSEEEREPGFHRTRRTRAHPGVGLLLLQRRPTNCEDAVGPRRRPGR